MIPEPGLGMANMTPFMTIMNPNNQARIRPIVIFRDLSELEFVFDPAPAESTLDPQSEQNRAESSFSVPQLVQYDIKNQS